MATKLDSGSTARSRKKQGPYLKVKFGSAVVPIYRTIANERTRFTLSFYRYGRRERKTFSCIDEAKKEALFVAQRVQSGMQHVTDLKPHERDSFKAAEALLEKLGISLYSAVEDYVSARTLAGTESLTLMATEYANMYGSGTLPVYGPLKVGGFGFIDSGCHLLVNLLSERRPEAAA